MEIGIQIEPQFGFSFDDITRISSVGLNTGFRKVWFSDHFMLDKSATDKVLLDPWLSMAALVRENPETHVGSLVFCNSYRNPALHAKMGATLDVLSEGRFDFGFGAGWKRIEYEAYGYTFPHDNERIDQLVEGIQIIRGAWTENLYNFTGKHYTVKDLISYPKPVQKPHPPIIVGTMYGRSRMVEVAARYGDGINLAWAFDLETVKGIFGKIDNVLKKTDRETSGYRKTLGYWTRVFESEGQIDEAIHSNAKKRGIPEEEYRKRVESALWGTPESIRGRLREYKDAGASDVILMFPHQQETQQMEMLGPVLSNL